MTEGWLCNRRWISDGFFFYLLVFPLGQEKKSPFLSVLFFFHSCTQFSNPHSAGDFYDLSFNFFFFSKSSMFVDSLNSCVIYLNLYKSNKNNVTYSKAEERDVFATLHGHVSAGDQVSSNEKRSKNHHLLYHLIYIPISFYLYVQSSFHHSIKITLFFYSSFHSFFYKSIRHL